MDQTHLSSLNPAQRAAVVYDVATAGRATPGRPLLIIAGAGSGKTKTSGPPGRAPAAERRRSRPHPAADLHAPGGRGDDPPGRAHLRPDHRRPRSQDRVVGHLPCRRQQAPAALCRADRAPAQLHGARPQRRRRSPQPGARRAGPQRAVPALSQEGDLPRDLLLRRQRPARPRPGPSEGISLVPGVAGRAQGAVRRLRAGQAGPGGRRLRRSPALLVGHDAGGGDRERRRPPFRLRPGRRVPGHQRAPGEDPARAQGRRSRPHGGRRRCPVDLRLPRRDGQEHPGFPGLLRSVGRGRDARAELPLDPADPGGRQRGHGPRGGRLHQEPVLRAPLGAEAPSGDGRRRDRGGRLRRALGAGEPRGRPGAARAGGAVPHLAPQRPARDRAAPPQHPLRQVRRAQVPRAGACQGPARDPALGREPARPRRGLPSLAAATRDRSRHRAPGARPARGGGVPLRSAFGRLPAARGRASLARSGRADAGARGAGALGRAARARAALLRPAARGALRLRPRAAAPTSTSWCASPASTARASSS